MHLISLIKFVNSQYLFIAIRNHDFETFVLTYCIISQMLFFVHNATKISQNEIDAPLKRNWRLLEELIMHP
jgi:hypothetical protein